MNIVLCDRPYETCEVKYQCCRRYASRQTVTRLNVTEFVGTLKNVSLFRIFFGGQETIFSVPEPEKIGLFCKKMFGCHGTRHHLLKKAQDFHLLLRLSVELERAWAQSPGLNFRLQLKENK